MIFYDLIEGDAYSKKINYKPKTCFIMTQLGSPIPNSVVSIRKRVRKCLGVKDIKTIDANYDVTGKDFLNKIWEVILSVPIGVAIITEDMAPSTLTNIFYELGLMQALGKGTLIIKTKESSVPSDFVRTEYIDYPRGFTNRFEKFRDGLFARAEHYYVVADQLEQNPVLAIDYLKRAYLITSEQKYKNRILEIIIGSSSLDKQSKDNIRNLLDL